jgi:cytoplasmic iron level regulating protein YaaA (DUF328/UPF0246 family)
MFVILSPAKTLDESPYTVAGATQPALLDQAESLIRTLRRRSRKSLSELMGISADLAVLNHQRYQSFAPPFTQDNAKAAVHMFQGDVYQGLDAATLDDSAIDYAQQHLRILSGLYGILRPLDLIQPYRLEMGTRLKTRRGAHLYAFWGDRVTDELQSAMQAAEDEVLLNLASNEYYKAVRPATLGVDVIAPAFRELRNGKLQMISFFAKRARGAMARWVIDKRVRTRADLLAFNVDGYAYDEAASKPGVPTFVRAAE